MVKKNKSIRIDQILDEDYLGRFIADKWHTWNAQRAPVLREWNELRNYLFATDTTFTVSETVPWKNRTTKPKLAQIRDGLFANYCFALMPKSKFVDFEPTDESGLRVVDKVEKLAAHWTQQPDYIDTVYDLLYDYIDTGNAFAMPEWIDDRRRLADGSVSAGYVGSTLTRISPYDIVFDPTASSFSRTPKIIRSFVSFGELESVLQSFSVGDSSEVDTAKKTIEYLKQIRYQIFNAEDNIEFLEEAYRVDGFGSFREYLMSNTVEMLTFYGDIFDEKTGKLYSNQKIVVVDQHKIVYWGEAPTILGEIPIYHAPWRKRPNNLWGMGPLVNLVGLQYRLDHLENARADLIDLSLFPILFIKGTVTDFEWAPLARAYSNDPNARIEPIKIGVSEIYQTQQETMEIMTTMEELAGSPKEALGFRTPGEKTAFEVQTIVNAASRIFQHKVENFERSLLEPALNGMLELTRRNITSALVIRKTLDDLGGAVDFETITKEDLSGNGRLRPVAARHFAEKNNLIQGLNSLVASGLWGDAGIRVHFSGKKLAKMIAEALDFDDYGVYTPYIQLAEDMESQTQAQVASEEAQMTALTDSGLTPSEVDMSAIEREVAMESLFGSADAGGTNEEEDVNQ